MHLILWIKKLLTGRYMRNRVTFILFFLLLSSCNKHFTRSCFFNITNRNKLNIQQFDFGYLTTKTKIKFSDKKNNIRVTANIRIKKDSIIWVSVSSTLGIEGVRARITTDSIHLIDRMNKTFHAMSYPSASKYFDFELNYNIIQAIIMGDPAYGCRSEDNIVRGDGFFILKQKINGHQIDNFISTNTMKVERMIVQHGESLNSLAITYSNFQMLNDQAFPFRSLISLSYKKDNHVKTTQVAFNHSKAHLENKELKFPFNVPKRYKTKYY